MGRYPDRPPEACFCRDQGRKRPPHANGCCQEGGYIVERIVSNQKEDICFEGLLQINGLPAHLCPPLSLCGIDVVCLEPCRAAEPCCAPRPMQRLAVTLCVCVIDSCGCRAEGEACIEISVCGRHGRELCGLNVRRGAQVYLSSACFCPPCAFQVCLNLCVQTILSRCEMIGQRPLCPSPCPDLPLYPPPVRRTRCGPFCEHLPC